MLILPNGEFVEAGAGVDDGGPAGAIPVIPGEMLNPCGESSPPYGLPTGAIPVKPSVEVDGAGVAVFSPKGAVEITPYGFLD